MDAAGAAAAAALLWSSGADVPKSDSEGTEPPSDQDEVRARHPAFAGSLVKLQNFPASWVEEDSRLLLPERLARLLERFGELALAPVVAENEGPLLYAAFVEASAATQALQILQATVFGCIYDIFVFAIRYLWCVYDPSEPLLGVQPLPPSQRRGSKPTLLGRKSEKPAKVSEDGGAGDTGDAKEEVVTQSTSSTSARRRIASAATPKRARAPPGKSRGAAAALLTQASPRGSKEVSPATGSTAPPAPPSHSEDSAPLGQSTQSVDSSSDTQVQSPRPAPKRALCCGDGLIGCFGGFKEMLRSPPERKLGEGAETAQLQLPLGRSFQEQRESERRARLAELNRRFAAAQEAAKGLLLSSDEKLQLYAYQKQAIEGPVFGSPPGPLNVTARSKWDAWAKLNCMEKDVAKQGYCALVDKFAPGWRTSDQSLPRSSLASECCEHCERAGPEQESEATTATSRGKLARTSKTASSLPYGADALMSVPSLKTLALVKKSESICERVKAKSIKQCKGTSQKSCSINVERVVVYTITKDGSAQTLDCRASDHSGIALGSSAKKISLRGRPAHPWERFSAKLEESPLVAKKIFKTFVRRAGPSGSRTNDQHKARASDGSETEPPTEPPSEAEDQGSQVSAKVLLGNFPVSWLALEVRPQLDARITALLTKFGSLDTLPEAVERAGSMIAVAVFQDAGAAQKAVQALDGFDWRSSEAAKSPPAAHECFSAKILDDEAEAALRLTSTSGDPDAPGAAPDQMHQPEDLNEQSAVGSPSPQSMKTTQRPARVKLPQTGRNLRWEKSSSEAEDEQPAWTVHPAEAAVEPAEAFQVGPEMRQLDLSDTHLVVSGLPWDWSALQLQMLFTPFGGVQAMQLGSDDRGGRLALVRLEELAQHAAAAVHFQQPQPGELAQLRCEHVLGPREKELLAQAAEAERLRKEAEEAAARQREAAAAEAEKQRQAVLFASRRVLWEAANADFAAAVLEQAAQPEDLERCKRLQAAAASLRDASLSKQRRRMFVALVEAERKRQAQMAFEMEHEAMRAMDMESKAWQEYLLNAEHHYLEMIRQAEAAETLAMSKADRESRRAEQARIDQERRRRRKERESQAAEGRAMKKADNESRRVEAAIFLEEEQAREEFETEFMERAEDEIREFLVEEARREADERRRMAADEAEFFRRQEEERRRRAEEERKQKLVLEWRRKKEARRALESDDDDEAPAPDDEEEDQEEPKEEKKASPTPQKAIVRNPFGPVNVPVPPKTVAQEDAKAKKAKEEDHKRVREEERRRLKEEASKRRKRETEEAAAELQKFEQELQRRSNFLLRRRQQEEEDLRKEEEAQQRAEKEEQERKQREFEASCMAREEKLRMPFELEERRQESERRKREETERRKQERAERKRKEQAKHLGNDDVEAPPAPDGAAA
ncbi:ACBP3 [Symbiodinium natans]|uniref:ACBP3 protein n=1 Tax=Symbiodinium natans TaxID=878477 RepID=A0A812I9F5_9DINO|nr:ACBP3 [Symbiodinium natans]